MLPLDIEVSVVLARDAQGNIMSFPTVENQHLNGILISVLRQQGVQLLLKRGRKR